MCGVSDGHITNKVWCGFKSGLISVWDAETFQKELEIRSHTAKVNQITQIGQHIWSVSTDGSVRIWDTQTIQPIRKLEDHPDSVTCVVFVDMTQCVWTAGKQGIIFVRNTNGKEISTVDIGAPVTSMLYTCRRVWCTTVEGKVRIFDPKTLVCVKIMNSHTHSVICSIATTSQVWTSSIDKIQIFNAEQMKTLKNIKAKFGKTHVTTMEVLPGGAVIANCTDGKVRVWSAEGGRIDGVDRVIQPPTFTPRGNKDHLQEGIVARSSQSTDARKKFKRNRSRNTLLSPRPRDTMTSRIDEPFVEKNERSCSASTSMENDTNNLVEISDSKADQPIIPQLNLSLLAQSTQGKRDVQLTHQNPVSSVGQETTKNDTHDINIICSDTIIEERDEIPKEMLKELSQEMDASQKDMLQVISDVQNIHQCNEDMARKFSNREEQQDRVCNDTERLRESSVQESQNVRHDIARKQRIIEELENQKKILEREKHQLESHLQLVGDSIVESCALAEVVIDFAKLYMKSEDTLHYDGQYIINLIQRMASKVQQSPQSDKFPQVTDTFNQYPGMLDEFLDSIREYVLSKNTGNETLVRPLGNDNVIRTPSVREGGVTLFTDRGFTEDDMSGEEVLSDDQSMVSTCSLSLCLSDACSEHAKYDIPVLDLAELNNGMLV